LKTKLAIRLASVVGVLAIVLSSTMLLAADTPTPTTQSEAGGIWLVGDHHMHTRSSDGSHYVTYDIEHSTDYGLDFITVTNHGGQANQPLIDEEYDIIEALRKQNPDLLIFHGFEWNVPSGEHATFLVIPSASENDRAQVNEFMSLYDQSLNPEANTEEKAIEALEYAEQMNPQPIIIINHPSRKGKYSTSEIRAYAEAGDVAIGFEGAPGHQANPDRGSYPAEEPGSSRTYGGYDKMTAEVGGLWDTLLDEGIRWFITANSDFHTHFTEGGDDFWPGQYTKMYVFASEKSYRAIAEGIAAGKVFTVSGDLIDKLDFTASNGNAQAMMGETLLGRSGDDVKVTIRVHDPNGLNNNYDNPALKQVQLISNASGDPEIVRVFTSADWQRDGEDLVMTHTFNDVGGDFYLRVRGSNTEELNPSEDPYGESAWNDLWFYSNPIFIEVD